MRAVWTASAVALLVAMPFAAEADGFRMPSGNVFCMLEEGDDSQSPDVRCDIVEMNNRPSRMPADCDLDWGDAFAISANSPRGKRICHGDTVRDPALPVLSYGSLWQRAGIACMSAPTGVTCQNEDGHGFSLARAQQRVF